MVNIDVDSAAAALMAELRKEDKYKGDPPEISDIPAMDNVLFAIMHTPVRAMKVNGVIRELEFEDHRPGSYLARRNTLEVSNDNGTLWELAALEAIKRDIGEWAEFGVWEGLSARYWYSHLPEHRKLYLFDSFEGLPEAWERREKGHFKLDHIPTFDSPRVITKEGWFKDTLPFDVPLGFVHIDSDLYSSAKEVLAGINVSKGSLILFDEFFGYPGWCKHEYKALMEWDRPFRFIARDKIARVLIEIL